MRRAPSAASSLAHAGEHVGEQRIVFVGVDDGVGCDAGNAALARERHEPHVAPRLLRRKMLLQLEVKALAEDPLYNEARVARSHSRQMDRPLSAISPSLRPSKILKS